VRERHAKSHAKKTRKAAPENGDDEPEQPALIYFFEKSHFSLFSFFPFCGIICCADDEPIMFPPIVPAIAFPPMNRRNGNAKRGEMT